MSDDELFYLQPGFDLNSLKVPRLREILVKHDVPYPASAKKPQLIEIVTNDLLPKAKKLLSAQKRTKRTSRGITDVPSSQEGTIAGEDEDDSGLMPPPPAPKTPRSRKSKSNIGGTEAGAETPTASRRPRTPSARKSTSKHPRQSDTETDVEKPQASSRKTRKSTPGPTPVRHSSVKIEEPELRVKRESLEVDASPFSDENPFQSGSSPPTESRRISSSSRSRKSLGTSTDKRKSSTSRRRSTKLPTEHRQADGISAPSRSTFEFQVARLHSEPASDGVDATEEFTPEEAKELQEESAGNGQLVQNRPSAVVRRRKKKATSTATKSVSLAIITTVLGAMAAWYRKEKIDIGYCGVGQPNWSLASNPHIPPWINDNLQPACEPCPQHGTCFPNMEVQCDNGFVLKPHELSLGGAVPFPPTCEPDSEKARKVKVVADRAVEKLRDRRAAYECGEEIGSLREDGPAATNDAVKTVVKAGELKLEIPEETLKEEVSKLRRKGMSAEEFDELWRSALGEIIERDEIDVLRDGSNRILLSSSSLAKLPFTCQLKRSVRLTISRNRGPISALVAFAALAFYVQYRIQSYRAASKQIPDLVSTTLDRLATQAALKEDGRVGEGFISVGQLRDDVLRNVFSARERERVWAGVRQVVEGNSNVRAGTREGGKTGEWSRVWEWIGPVNLVPGLEGRRSGGGGEISESADASAVDDSGVATPSALSDGNSSARRWDEGRPIY